MFCHRTPTFAKYVIQWLFTVLPIISLQSCGEYIPNLKSIDTHLATDKHIANKRKPTLMQVIDKTDDPVLKIGLQFITEEKIADSSNVVYECELCNCFDCNTDKMFAHIQSYTHRVKLLVSFDHYSLVQHVIDFCLGLGTLWLWPDESQWRGDWEPGQRASRQTWIGRYESGRQKGSTQCRFHSTDWFTKVQSGR